MEHGLQSAGWLSVGIVGGDSRWLKKKLQDRCVLGPHGLRVARRIAFATWMFPARTYSARGGTTVPPLFFHSLVGHFLFGHCLVGHCRLAPDRSPRPVLRTNRHSGGHLAVREG